MTYDSYFATQYKDCFIFFGIQTGTSTAKTAGEVSTLSGCIASVNEVDKEDGYIWSAMPQLGLQLSKGKNSLGSFRLLGGYTHGDEIKVFGTIKKKLNKYQLYCSYS